MKEPHLILGIGELLWDILPQHSGPAGIPIDESGTLGLLGGAPANFTVMAGRLGNHAAILSRIGRDDLGRKAVDLLDPLPADTTHLQIDPMHETGRVTVALKDGQPEYIIHQPAAWDSMELSDEWVQLANPGRCHLLRLTGATQCRVPADHSDTGGADLGQLRADFRRESARRPSSPAKWCRSRWNWPPW